MCQLSALESGDIGFLIWGACAVPHKISCAAACFYLHMWVPALLWEIELTNKRQHAQHCWAELITFTIRIVCSGFVAPGPQGPPKAVRPRGRGSAAASDAQLES